MKKKFTCPRRVADGRTSGRFKGDGIDVDKWDKHQQCSYDGSLHPDVFMEYVRSGGKIGPTDKSYKFSLEEYEGEVRGARKFYTHHLSDEQGWEFDQLWRDHKVNWGYPGAPYVPLYIPGPSTRWTFYRKKPVTEYHWTLRPVG